MTRMVALVVVCLLIVWLLKLTRDQKEIWLLLNSLSVVPGEIRLADGAGETNIKGGCSGSRDRTGYAVLNSTFGLSPERWRA